MAGQGIGSAQQGFEPTAIAAKAPKVPYAIRAMKARRFEPFVGAVAMTTDFAILPTRSDSRSAINPESLPNMLDSPFRKTLMSEFVAGLYTQPNLASRLYLRNR